jgi:SAM-dependent MidA family methyltransferase
MSFKATVAGGLPEPDSMSLAHSGRVGDYIAGRIAAAGGAVSFAEYMQMALYAPGLGYYAAGATKFGPEGDFVTAPEISPLFARVLARQCALLLVQLENGAILELGAGSGVLCADMLLALERLDVLPSSYVILEVSADLRQRQEETLQRVIPHLASRVQWLDRLPMNFEGVVIANEVADAMPVERFCRTRSGVERFEVIVENDEFAWRTAPAPPVLRNAVNHIEDYLGRALPADYVSDICLPLGGWIQQLAACLKKGFIFLFDYGLPRHEYYAQDRCDGTLICHFRHRAHSNPLVLPGIQDITAWVDFTAVAEAASAANLEVDGFVSQANFLVGGGLDRELADFSRLELREQVELSRQAKILTLPGEMGEVFKCIGLRSGELVTPEGFAFGDRAHML